MQQAIYSNIRQDIAIGKTVTPASRRASLGRRFAQSWDLYLYGVVALMLSSGMYGLYAIAHTL